MMVLMLAATVWASSAAAKSPPGRYVITNNGATVEDWATGLTWMRQELCCFPPNQAEKLACTDSKLAGGGWRAPTLRELSGILDRGIGTLVDTEAFAPPNTAGFKPLLTSTVHFVKGKGLVPRGVGMLLAIFVDIAPTELVGVRCVRP
ncbi:MAG: DUF1566 domain-containing protein [Deltaproteobacteria bacterium]|nr:DUF1566 domain-containing protein [Deltaproteobacteria bacterium]